MGKKRGDTSMHFRVPNTATGRRWIEQARAYKNRDKVEKVCARPRGSRKTAEKEGFRLNSDRDMPRRSAACTGFAVYLREPGALWQRERERNEKVYDWHRKQAWANAEAAVREFIAEQEQEAGARQVRLHETISALRKTLGERNNELIEEHGAASRARNECKASLGHIRFLQSCLTEKDRMILRISRAGWAMLAITVTSLGAAAWGWLT